MSQHELKPDAWHRSLGEDPIPVAHDLATLRAITQAGRLTQECHDHGRLFKPHEALALACKDGHSTETLYSLARSIAGSTGGDLDIILKHLEQDWPDFI